MMIAMKGDVLYVVITDLNIAKLGIEDQPISIDFDKARRDGILSRNPTKICIFHKANMKEAIDFMAPLLPPGSAEKARAALDPVTGEIRKEASPVTTKRVDKGKLS